MSIQCQLCQKTFEKLISSTHLKHSHQISSAEYKIQFGNDSLASPEYKVQRSLERSGENNSMYGKKHTDQTKLTISEKNSGKIPHNKGKKITCVQQLDVIRESIRIRDEKYKETGYHPRRGKTHNEDTKKILSIKIKTYAEENQDLLKIRAEKIVKTKKSRGFDFGSTNRGNKHSPESKEKIRTSSIKSGLKKTNEAKLRYEQAACEAHIQIIGYSGKIVSCQCLECENTFEYTLQYFSNSKFRIDLCPHCREQTYSSKAEVEILNFIRSSTSDIVCSRNRKQIFPLELDIYIPNQNLAIEYCGLYWHSELKGKTKEYHLHKHTLCQQKNIRLITIFEDEWLNNPDIVKSRLSSALNASTTKIGARECNVSSIPNKLAKQFCKANHIQGAGNASISYGLFKDNTLLSVMTFSKPNISKGNKNQIANTWELNRFCSTINYNIMGGANKLFSKFLKDHSPDRVISYSDLRWNTGKVYERIGFVHHHRSPPNYWYINFQLQTRIHRYNLRKNSQDEKTLTEWQNRQLQGWNRIWDCGNDVWIWSKK